MAPKLKGADYDTTVTALFSRLVNKYGPNDAYDYDKDLLEEVIDSLVKENQISAKIKNIPDIKYTYDARKDFPKAVSDSGHWAIIGRGKSKYRILKIKRNNLIRIPKDLDGIPIETYQLPDKTPSLVAQILGSDEQATMTRIRYSNVLSHFTGLETYHVQGHERTTVSVGQIEVDEVYAAQGKAGGNSERFILPISAKGGETDHLSYTQALNLSLYASEKTVGAKGTPRRYAGFTPRPLGIMKHPNGAIYIVEFSFAKNIHDVQIVRVAAYQLK